MWVTEVQTMTLTKEVVLLTLIRQLKPPNIKIISNLVLSGTKELAPYQLNLLMDNLIFQLNFLSASIRIQLHVLISTKRSLTKRLRSMLVWINHWLIKNKPKKLRKEPSIKTSKFIHNRITVILKLKKSEMPETVSKKMKLIKISWSAHTFLLLP